MPLLLIVFLSVLDRCSSYHVCYGFMASAADLGWTYSQNLARAWADETLGTTSFYVEDMHFMSSAEQRAMMDMFISGVASNSRPCELIIIGSDNFEDLTYEYAVANPRTKFVCVASRRTLPNLAGAYVRGYQGYYIAGVVAAMQPGVNKVGYVGSIFVGSSLSHINAFALGMRSVNSSAQVSVMHVGSWYDPRKERIAGLRLINRGVNLVLYDSDSTEVVRLAKEQGIYSIAMKSDGTALHGDSNLMSIMYVWNSVFVDVISVAMSNDTFWASEKDRNIFVGVEKDAISRGTFSSHVPAVSRLRVQEILDKFKRGEDEVFCAASFRSYCPSGATWERDAYPCDSVSVRSPNASVGEVCLSDDTLRTMSWFIQDAVVDLGFLQVPSECGPGFKMDALKQELCVPCEPGKYTDQIDMTACISCPVGYYNDLANSSMCKLCHAGTYSSSSTICTLCPAGKYSSGGVAACTDCPVGYSLSTTGGTGLRSCELCATGSFANVSGSPVCTQCPDSLTTKAMASDDPSACVCAAGFFQRRLEQHCSPCPEGMRCPVGSKESSLFSAEPHPLLREGFSSSTSMPLSIFECDLKIRCPGGDPGSCASGFSATACDGCPPGRFMAGRGDCESCEVGGARLLVAVFAIPALAALFLMHRMVNTPMILTQRTSMQATFLLGMAITAVLTFSIYEGFNFTWMAPLDQAFKLVKVLSLDLNFLAFECTFGNSRALPKCLVRLLAVPAAFAALVGVSGVFHVIPRSRHLAHFSAPDLQNTLGHLMVVFLIAMTLMSVEGFKCMAHPNGKQTLFADHTILCWETGDHTWIVAISIVAVLVYPVAFLAGCGVLVWKFTEWASIYGTDFVLRTRFLTGRMKPGQHLFGYAFIVRNVVLSIMPLVHQNYGVQVLMLEIVFLIWLVAQVFVRPWRFQVLNIFDCMNSLMQILILACLGSMNGARSCNTEVLAKDFGWAVIALFCSTIATLCGVASFCALQRVRGRKEYAFFLTHHKASAGLFSRQIKCMLEAALNVRVFLDVDELDNLDNLAFTVRTSVDNLIILETSEVYARPWCAVEIVTAWMNGITTLIASVDTQERILTEEYIQSLTYRWGLNEVAELSTSGIGMGDVEVAYRRAAGLRAFQLSMSVTFEEQSKVVRDIAGAGKLHVRSNDLVCHTSNEPGVFVVFDSASQAQTCVARIAVLLLEELHWTGTMLSAPGADLAEPQKAVLVLLSTGVSRNPMCLGFITALQTLELPFVSAISQEAFSPPDPTWLQRLREGTALAPDEEEVFRRIVPSSSSRAAVSTLQELYKVLAWRFNPQDTDKVMRVEFLRIIDRGLRSATRPKKRTASASMSNLNSAGSQACSGFDIGYNSEANGGSQAGQSPPQHKRQNEADCSAGGATSGSGAAWDSENTLCL